MTFLARKRILLVTRNFPPLTGGMERLNYHIYLELEKEFQVSIAGSEGCQNFLSPNTKFAVFPSRPVGLFLLRSFIATYRLAVKENPDLIIAGSGVTAIAALLAGRRANAKVMVFIHGLDILFPHPIYQYLFLPAIRSCDAILVNSSHTANLARQKKINTEKINVLNPGVTLPGKNNLASNPSEFKKSFSIGENRIILLSVGRLTERKGLPEFIQNCLPKIVSELPETLLLVIGNEATDALTKQTNISAIIKHAAFESKLENNVLWLGNLSDAELSQAYIASEILVFPVLDLPGDVEGFGMVAVEAAAHGLPTAAFSVGGATDAVSHNSSGWLVKSGDYSELSNTILNYLKLSKEIQPNNVSEANCRKHAAKFSWDLFGQRLRKICQKIISNETKRKH